MEVLHIGERGITFRHTLNRKADGGVCATAHHVVVTARISEIATVPVPEEMRGLLARHVTFENALRE
jgi:acyl-CoA thioesterase FadM